jgi:hypothetical protein
MSDGEPLGLRHRHRSMAGGVVEHGSMPDAAGWSRRWDRGEHDGWWPTRGIVVAQLPVDEV